ncbi:hypothetical protein OIU76_021601 [Salix suchowensis]|nr:hypothetical protein OIU76_021601 [Salix suchowensis]
MYWKEIQKRSNQEVSAAGWVSPNFTNSLLKALGGQTWYLTFPEGERKTSASSSFSEVRLVLSMVLLSTFKASWTASSLVISSL